MNTANIVSHPILLRRHFRRYLLYLGGGAAFQASWALICLLLVHIHPLMDQLLPETEGWTFKTIVTVYSLFSLTQAFYILLTILMAYFLNSRVWFYTGLLFSALPGLIPSLVQIPLALFLWLEVRREEWDHFFSRFDDVRRMKGLTDRHHTQL